MMSGDGPLTARFDNVHFCYETGPTGYSGKLAI